MQINLIADGSVAAAPAGFTADIRQAADVLERSIPGAYTVNITYGWGTYDNATDAELSPSSNALSVGGPSGLYDVDYDTLKGWLTAAAGTAYQVAAVRSLPATPPLGKDLTVSPAQLKAFGASDGDPAAVDGSIGFNTADAAAGKLSPYIVEAGITEIAHALGLLSGLGESYADTLDLFRYSAPGVLAGDDGQPSYFSVDGGRTDLADYSTETNGGVSDPTLFENLHGDPFGIPLDDGGAQTTLTTLDLAELDAMGFAGTTNLFGTVTDDPASAAGQVAALYQTILGRAADGGGLATYTAQVEGGTAIASVAQSMLSSAEYAADNGTATPSDAGFIDQLYADGLHRAPDTGGFDTYQAALAGGVSRAQVAVDIATSDESRADLAPVFAAGLVVPGGEGTPIAQLYYGLLDRAPDAGGLAEEEIFADRGGMLLDVAADFIASPEYAGLHGTQSDAQFVSDLYEGALGRAPDAGGAATYLGALAGGASRAQVALDVTQSAEATTRLAPLIQADYHLA